MLIPQVIMMRTSLDHTKYCRIPLIKYEKIYGQYVHTHDNPHHLNNFKPRIHVTITLVSTVNIQAS